MRHSKVFSAIAIIALLAGSLTACKNPPTDAMEASRQALEDADGAQQCASAEYARAEQLLRQAEQAIEDKEYDRAEQLANQAKAQAEQAMEVAQRNPYYPECDLAEEILRKIDRVESMSSLRNCAPERYQNAVDLAEDAKAALDAKEFDRASELADNAIEALEDAESYARQQDGYPECDDSEDEAARSYDWERVQFAFDSSHLDRAARQILDSHADYLKDSADVDITIEGHCSIEGTSEYNMALGQRRATSAKRYIQNLGVESNRMRTVSYGEERPLERGAGAINRRAEFKTR